MKQLTSICIALESPRLYEALHYGNSHTYILLCLSDRQAWRVREEASPAPGVHATHNSVYAKLYLPYMWRAIAMFSNGRSRLDSLMDYLILLLYLYTTQ